MRHSQYGGYLLAAAAALCGPGRADAQAQADGALRTLATPAGYTARGQLLDGGTEAVPGRPPIIAPIPTGNPGNNGFYGTTEFLYYSQTFALGAQTVAVRGLIDTSGILTGQPGTLVGSAAPALVTDQFGRRSFQPGWRVGVGYKFTEGVSVFANFAQLIDQTYSAGASNATQFGVSQADLADTFLLSPVFNFPPDYSGPAIKTAIDQQGIIDGTNPGGNFNGIWNGATTMDIQFTQRFTQGNIGARVPLLQTEYSRVYGMGGFQYSWFYEKFYWRTMATDISGRAFPQDVAIYTNYLSQRMYGPFLGCGHEIYVGKRFGVSVDLTAAGLMSIAKQRVYYELGDKSTKAKRSRNEFDFVPNANLDVGLMWYPIEGVQVRVGYSLNTFYNTRYMGEPVAFNFGALDPDYGTKAFRYVSGFNVGVGFFF